MSKSKLKYGVYNGKVLKKLLENSRLYFLALLFAIGIFFGAFLIKCDSELSSKIISIADSYSYNRAQQGIADNFTDSFAVGLLFNVLSVFFSFSLIGYPFIMWLPVVRGMGLGAYSGYIYSIHKLTGLGYCVLTIYPAAIISTFSFLLACNDGCEYSKNAFAKAIKGRGQFEKDETKIFITRQMIFLAVCAASAAVDAVFASLFSGLFKI